MSGHKDMSHITQTHQTFIIYKEPLILEIAELGIDEGLKIGLGNNIDPYDTPDSVHLSSIEQIGLTRWLNRRLNMPANNLPNGFEQFLERLLKQKNSYKLIRGDKKRIKDALNLMKKYQTVIE